MILAGKKFTSIREAFEYFEKEIYPNLDPQAIQEIKSPVYYFRSGKTISDDRLEKILKKYGNAEIKKNVLISFN